MKVKLFSPDHRTGLFWSGDLLRTVLLRGSYGSGGTAPTPTHVILSFTPRDTVIYPSSC